MAAHRIIVSKIILSVIWFASLGAWLLLPQPIAFAQSASSSPVASGSATSSTYVASLTITPAAVNATVGQTFTVSIQLDTGGHQTDGTRVVLLYDKNLLSLTHITPGSIYNQYPSSAQSIDDSTGTAKIIGVADSGQTYSGSGTFATVDFTPKAAGTASIKFDFRGLGVTDDSNVADTATSTDILGTATGSTVTIGGSTSVPTPPASIAPRTKLPNTASVNPTIVFASFGGGLVLVGLGLLIAL